MPTEKEKYEDDIKGDETFLEVDDSYDEDDYDDYDDDDSYDEDDIYDDEED